MEHGVSSSQILDEMTCRKLKTMKNLGIGLIAGGVIMMIITAVNFMSGGAIDLGTVRYFGAEIDPRTWTPMIGTALMIAGVIVLLVGSRDERMLT